MANVFETALLSRRSAVNNRVRPQFADPIFWPDILMSRVDAPPPPQLTYTLITSTGDELVDQFNNQFIAAY